jgi:hypothetical protein
MEPPGLALRLPLESFQEVQLRRHDFTRDYNRYLPLSQPIIGATSSRCCKQKYEFLPKYMTSQSWKSRHGNGDRFYHGPPLLVHLYWPTFTGSRLLVHLYWPKRFLRFYSDLARIIESQFIHALALEAERNKLISSMHQKPPNNDGTPKDNDSEVLRNKLIIEMKLSPIYDALRAYLVL